MTALAAMAAADLEALARVEEPRFGQYWATGAWFHAGDRDGWRGIGWAVWMESAARLWIPPHAASLFAWGVTDGRALVHLAYDEDEARSWAVVARAEYRNRQIPPPAYAVVRLSAQRPGVALDPLWDFAESVASDPDEHAETRARAREAMSRAAVFQRVPVELATAPVQFQGE
ncbi:hypothetical protein WS58_10995 [Burkholderia pseudomultivorans]|uniref:hypothetical protein n=1 Tax=Burkholderia pseudomultivorans TaxID=1207504 RepID=UPI0007599D62|nr:hypothetical protein [Burkholderia pseudomultivorans]KVC46439.1 hypothetical protein WS58_10995 [Burkholderia pseudomultivorans]